MSFLVQPPNPEKKRKGKRNKPKRKPSGGQNKREKTQKEKASSGIEPDVGVEPTTLRLRVSRANQLCQPGLSLEVIDDANRNLSIHKSGKNLSPGG